MEDSSATCSIIVQQAGQLELQLKSTFYIWLLVWSFFGENNTFGSNNFDYAMFG